jgi:alkanesulfonate monooxygenase SsuD/methylene tetrahydromethanopterin reductase-like flavin-dependent oxidoreductase (luciferase family)
VRRFGLYLSLQHPAERDPRELVAERLELVALVRDAGFNSVFCGQHFLVPGDVQMLQPVPILGRIAAEAGSLTIGTGILITTLLNPVEVAENAATLAAIAPGRFVLGAGVGYRPEENAAFGVEQGRIHAFEDKLRVIRRLLDGEEVTASGPGFRLEGASLTLRPEPRPALWVAATTQAGIERAAELGDAWLAAPSARVSEIRHGREILTARLGREPRELPALREAVVAPTRAEAVALAEPFLDPRGTSSAGPVALEPGRYIVGAPDEAAGELEALFDAGVDHVIFRIQRPGIAYRDAIRTIELLASDVIPSLAD